MRGDVGIPADYDHLERRYEEQHRMLHSAEDEIARLRAVEAAAREVIAPVKNVPDKKVHPSVARLRAVLSPEEEGA